MAKILISNQERTRYLTGSLSRQQFWFTPEKSIAFMFDTERNANEFKEAELAEFLQNKLTDLVSYDQPDKSIYS